jgi:V8-like Glu-specific endopeptidase
MKFVIIILVIHAFLFSVAKADFDPDKVIGPNDLVFVSPSKENIPFKYRNLVEAIGLMDVGCTVTYIGQGYAVTAGHCIWTEFFTEIPKKPFINLPCKDDFGHQFEIWWGYRGEEGSTPKSKGLCERIVYALVTDHFDFAILKVSNPPKAKIPVELEKHSQLGDRITVFSHADNMPLQWSRNCSIKRIIAATIDISSLMHVCDTNPGSSGAAIIDLQTLKIVGLHNGGIHFEDVSEELPIFFDPDPSSEKLGINYGTYIMDSPARTILKNLGF